MSATWLVAAESSRARIFSIEDSQAPMREVVSLTNPEGRLHERELVSDRPGRTFDSKGGGRHGKEAPTDSKKQASIEFAHSISGYLESNNDKFNKLVLIAAPSFLGVLRKDMKGNISRKIVREIDRNVVRMSTDEIRGFLKK